MTDFRALCAELVDELEDWIAYGDEADCADAHAFVDRARAALAQPEPQGPTDEGLDELFTEIDQSGESESWRTYARAVRARWGTRTLEPIPLAERQPTEADCDAEGRCWWWHPESYERNACWCYSRGSGVESLWLPHWKLPMPGVEVKNG